jgi:hypothetical protein
MTLALWSSTRSVSADGNRGTVKRKKRLSSMDGTYILSGTAAVLMNLGPLFLFAGPCFTPFERERRRHESKNVIALFTHT